MRVIHKYFLLLLIMFSFIFVFPIVQAIASPTGCTTTCSTSSCSNVTFTQTQSSWSIQGVCDGQIVDLGSGSGNYEGTICDGVTPCSLPEEA